jgi:hypothetical protein
MARSLIMNDCVEYDGRLMVATGDSDHRAVRVWALDEQQRWHDASGQALEGLPSSRSGGMWIYCLHSDGHSLFAGTAGHQGSARVYRYTPPAIAAKG